MLSAPIRSAFARSHGTYGSLRMTRELQDKGLPVRRRRTAQLMRENGLQAVQKRRFERTTDSGHAFWVAPISSSRTSRLSARTRSGPQISRTYGQTRAGCIWP
ncbi:transposase [Microvirga arabica]|nr:transposase [Microvirga arabica]